MSHRTAGCTTPHRGAGFTFFELLMVGSIVFVLLGGIMLALSHVGTQVWNRTEVQQVSLDSVQRALDRMSEDLRQASQTGLGCAAGTLTLTPAVGGGGQIRYSRAANGQLSRLQGGVTVVVASGLTAFTPTCSAEGNAGLTRLALTAQATGPGGLVSAQTLSTHVWVQSP